MFGRPDFVKLFTEDAEVFMTDRGSAFVYGDVTVSFEEGENLKVTLEAKETKVAYLGFRYNREWAEDTLFYGDTFERNYEELYWRGFFPDRAMAWYFAGVTEGRLEAYGCKTRPNSFVFFTSDAEGFSVWMDVRCGAMPVSLGGRKLEVATFVYHKEEASKSEAFRFMRRFCKKLCDDPVFPPRPVYGSNNWYYAYGISSAKDIIEDTKILIRQTEGLGNRPYMVIDDCWQPLARCGKSAQGRPMDRGNEFFPDMKGLADEIRRMGAHPGIWFRPLRTEERYIDKSIITQHGHTVMDPSCPKTLELVAEDTERLTKEWGYELIKYDFATRDTLGIYVRAAQELFAIRDWSFKDTTRTSAEIIKDLYRTIYEHSNGAVIIGCNVIGHLAAGLIHIHRSGDDTSGRHYDRSVKYGISALALRYPQHKAFYDIDADCLCVTKDIPWDKNRDLIDLYSRSATPFFASISPDAVTEEVDRVMKEAYKLAEKQEASFEPLDWLNTVCPEHYMINGKEYRYKWYPAYGKEWVFAR